MAFTSLIPDVAIPEPEEVEKLVKKGKGLATRPSDVIRDWHNLMSPSESVNLPNSKIAFLPKGDSAFEIEETVFNTGASKMFSKTSKRKMVLRAVSQEEAVDWIVTLKAQR